MLIEQSLPEECKAFLSAWDAIPHWDTPLEPEPTVLFKDRRITISEACNLVANLTDMIVPEGFYTFEPERPTYADAAQDALAQIEYHREYCEKGYKNF